MELRVPGSNRRGITASTVGEQKTRTMHPDSKVVSGTLGSHFWLKSHRTYTIIQNHKVRGRGGVKGGCRPAACSERENRAFVLVVTRLYSVTIQAASGAVRCSAAAQVTTPDFSLVAIVPSSVPSMKRGVGGAGGTHTMCVGDKWGRGRIRYGVALPGISVDRGVGGQVVQLGKNVAD